MFDTHVHTSISGDCNMPIEDAIKRAKALGMGMIVTDHMDIKYPKDNLFVFDVDDFFNRYEKYRSDKVLLGIEMGLRSDVIEENRNLEKNYDFDYVLGSIHVVNSVDIYEEKFYLEKSKREAYLEYFNGMLDGVRENEFIDSLAHIDYIGRYARYDDREIYYNDHREIIDEILREVAMREKSLEINTRRLGNRNTLDELFNIYKRFHELGGKTVTIGSDGHTTDSIGSNFKGAMELASSCNLRPVYYKRRKCEYL
ncbi:MAG: histidinol phosphate phosphatase [Anaeromicrobium sp.]|uniref:histidinol phosphate phosphatase n=1 Tax=Anaeromicrobium sp. TaxID=1929132 RepID=UPI0025DD8A0A|nr:histidinol phosphate phosphatase [Anaeromicrobium sp.]MCT4593899.1 histidinol phosphate phosphatase [Anaeromicrobium sp.]